jgi:hypothetical protein
LRLSLHEFAERIGCGVDPGPGELVDQAELAALLQISDRQIRNLMTRGLPFTREGGVLRYPVMACTRWHVAFLRMVAQRLPVHRLELIDAERELLLADFQESPDDYDIVQRPIVDALRAAVIEIDAGALAEFEVTEE